MDDACVTTMGPLSAGQLLTTAMAQQQRRLRAFVRRQVANVSDADDIVQEVFAELFDAYRLMQPIERVGAWLMRVARNRVIDRYRARTRDSLQTEPQHAAPEADPEPELLALPAALATGPEAEYRRAVWAAAIEAAMDELPPEQRAVFIAHELEGRSFRELAAETGVSINTLLGRKHDAVQRLRKALQDSFDDLEM
jgi:RNA polymerase sigma factor (sigma-70 family)